jgi:hypothetical protein
MHTEKTMFKFWVFAAIYSIAIWQFVNVICYLAPSLHSFIYWSLIDLGCAIYAVAHVLRNKELMNAF